MPTNAAIGYGFALAYSATSGGTYTALAEIEDLKPGKITVEKVTIQSNTSATLFGDKIPGWYDAADWDVKLIYFKTIRATLDSMKGQFNYWKFTYPDGSTTDAFYGFISEIGDEVPLKQAMTTDIKITVSGATTFTAGS